MTPEQELASLLACETQSLQNLLVILNQEYDALLSADITAIEQATAAKNQALAEQAEIAQSRRNPDMGAYFIDNREGAQQLTGAFQNDHELSAAFSHLNSLAQQCQETNRANGKLIAQKQQQARGALNIIRQTENNTSTYSGLGKTTEGQDSRFLGKA